MRSEARTLLVLLALVLHGSAAAVSPVIDIAPGSDAQAIIDAAPNPSTFRFTAGVHRDFRRWYVIHPRSGDTFTGEVGAVISGAKLLPAAQACGAGVWCYPEQTQHDPRILGECAATHPRCNRSESLWVDDVLQRHVGDRAEVQPGTWFFDYDAATIYLGTDPAGRTVETTVVSAFTYPFSPSQDVTIRGLRITKFGTWAQFGAVQADAAAAGWTVEGNEIDGNHGCGVRVGTEWRVAHNRIHHNGQIGVCGSGDRVLIEGDELAFNNTAGFSAGWEAGGMKLTRTHGAIVRGNHAHHNRGPGLWTDIDNAVTLYEGNRSTDNCAPDAAAPGIFHEISGAAIIRHNTIERNGLCLSAWGWGAGILIAASSDVEIYGNTLTDNGDGIVAIQQDRGSGYQVRNLFVHHNHTTATEGWTGLVQDLGDVACFSDARHNHFAQNTYTVPAGALAFTWNNAEFTLADWYAAGQDAMRHHGGE